MRRCCATTRAAGISVMCGPCSGPTARLWRSITSTMHPTANVTSPPRSGTRGRFVRSRARMLLGRTSLLAAAAACAALSPPAHAQLARARIQPSVVSLSANAQQQFRVSAMMARLEAATTVHNVKWSVNDVFGGTPEFGTIDANGLYRAPAKMPVPREVHIGAEVEGVSNRFVW